MQGNVEKMKLLIWGVSNIGKTTIGRELSKKLQCKFYDIDKEIINIMEALIIFKRYILMIMIDLMKKKK